MNALFSTSVGFGVRLFVNSIASDGRLGAALVGLCEGIILYHSRPGTPSFDASSNPYAAYGLRILIDLLYTQGFVRMAIVLLWTVLGVVVADVLQTFADDGRSRSNKSHSTPKDKTGRSSKPGEPVAEYRRSSRTHKPSDIPSPSRRLARSAPRVYDEVLPGSMMPTWPGGQSDLSRAPGSTRYTQYNADHDLLSSPVILNKDLPSPPLPAVNDPTVVEQVPEPLNLDDSQLIDTEVLIEDIPDGAELDEISPIDPVIDQPVPDDAPEIPPAGLPGIPLTLASEQSPERIVQDVADARDQAERDGDSDGEAVPVDENAIPLPVTVHDTSTDHIDITIPNPADISASVDTPLSALPQDKATLTAQARVWRGKADNAERERDRLEATRKEAAREGRAKDVIGLESQRDKIAAKALRYREREAQLFHRADNLDLPPGTIDVHHSTPSSALKLIKEKYVLMLRNNEPQLRVIVSMDVNWQKQVQHGLAINHVPCYVDPYRKQCFVLTVPP